MGKTRLDVLLVERNLITSRDKAKRMIMAGLVFSGHERLDKPGMKVENAIPIEIKGNQMPYVGRGGLKLEKALQFFNICVKNKIMVDVGSSTGGFTDCALQAGARLSYAVDVGYNQLDWKLRNDDRVIVMERTNFRYVTPSMFEEGMPNFATVDVSFISLRLILPVLKTIISANSDIVILIKPQFEAGREQIGKKGVVRDRKIHEDVLNTMVKFINEEEFELFNMTYSPITGGEGNVEFLAHLGWKKDKKTTTFSKQDIHHLVNQAHNDLAHVN